MTEQLSTGTAAQAPRAAVVASSPQPGICLLRLDRPHALNAMSLANLREIHGVLDGVLAGESVAGHPLIARRYADPAAAREAHRAAAIASGSPFTLVVVDGAGHHELLSPRSATWRPILAEVRRLLSPAAATPGR